MTADVIDLAMRRLEMTPRERPARSAASPSYCITLLDASDETFAKIDAELRQRGMRSFTPPPGHRLTKTIGGHAIGPGEGVNFVRQAVYHVEVLTLTGIQYILAEIYISLRAMNHTLLVNIRGAESANEAQELAAIYGFDFRLAA